MNKNQQMLLTFALLIALLGVLAVLRPHPHPVQSLIGRPAPAFTHTFTHTAFSDSALRGHVTVVNFFASWCPPCEAENSVLLSLKNKGKVVVYGVDYKDSPAKLHRFLSRVGNPYTTVTPDPAGTFSALWHVSGVPETFVIDKDGIIRYRRRQPLTPADVKTNLLPLIQSLKTAP